MQNNDLASGPASPAGRVAPALPHPISSSVLPTETLSTSPLSSGSLVARMGPSYDHKGFHWNHLDKAPYAPAGNLSATSSATTPAIPSATPSAGVPRASAGAPLSTLATVASAVSLAAPSTTAVADLVRRVATGGVVDEPGRVAHGTAAAGLGGAARSYVGLFLGVMALVMVLYCLGTGWVFHQRRVIRRKAVGSE